MFLSIFLKNYWKQILMALAIGIAVKLGYSYIYDRGYNLAYVERTRYYEDIRTKDRNALVSKIDKIEKLSNDNALLVQTQQDKLVNSLNALTTNLDNKKFYKVNVATGDCAPSVDFIDTFNTIIRKANEKPTNN